MDRGGAHRSRPRFNDLTVVKLALQMLARTSLSPYQARLAREAVAAVDRHTEALLAGYCRRPARAAPRGLSNGGR
jgi:hypothetical protein